MTDKIEVRTRFNADIIETSTMLHHGLRYDDIAVKVINLQEKGVIDALKYLGWTPPNESPRIKMSKTLPSEEGKYWWSSAHKEDPIVCGVHIIGGQLIAVTHGCSVMPKVESLGGYWAKVESEHFEFEC